MCFSNKNLKGRYQEAVMNLQGVLFPTIPGSNKNSVSVDLASGLYGDPHHPALPDPSAHQPMPAMPEGATNVMDTTFYYALYLVLFIGTLIGNFFLVCQILII